MILTEYCKNINDFWSDKNEKNPSEYDKYGKEKVWWKCENGIHDDYLRMIKSSTVRDYKCPKCGHIRGGHKIFQDLTGNKYGRLTVIKLDKERMDKENNHKTYWLCKCDCGNEKLASVWSNSLKQGSIVSCGCYHLERISGENSVHWKGGVTPKATQLRTSLDYKNWVRQVYAKDYYTCQCCGKNININKQAHHLYNFSDHENIRYDINNGITLCDECHYSTIKGSFHNIYGTSNNTPEQLEEYINNKRKELGINIPFSIESYLSGNCLKPKNVA